MDQKKLELLTLFIKGRIRDAQWCLLFATPISSLDKRTLDWSENYVGAQTTLAGIYVDWAVKFLAANRTVLTPEDVLLLENYIAAQTVRLSQC